MLKCFRKYINKHEVRKIENNIKFFQFFYESVNNSKDFVILNQVRLVYLLQLIDDKMRQKVRKFKTSVGINGPVVFISKIYYNYYVLKKILLHKQKTKRAYNCKIQSI